MGQIPTLLDPGLLALVHHKLLDFFPIVFRKFGEVQLRTRAWGERIHPRLVSGTVGSNSRI